MTMSAAVSASAAQEAVELFCYSVRKALGSLIAVLGGLDTLIFTAGIGEHVPEVRERILSGLEDLGIALDAGRNRANQEIISRREAPVTVRVVHSDEERGLARHARSLRREASS